MVGLFLSMFLLGIAAIDPVGIAAMFVLLIQKNPYVRSFVFLFGGFAALFLMGIVFSQGLGVLILRFEAAHSWLIPTIELIAGIVLLGIAVYLLRKSSKERTSAEPSRFMAQWLRLSNWRLFMVGALLVTVQSIIDVVFVVAMIRLGALHLSSVLVITGVTIYAIAALLLQIAIVVVYYATPARRQARILQAMHRLTERYTDRLVIVVSFLIGGILILNSILISMGRGLF